MCHTGRQRLGVLRGNHVETIAMVEKDVHTVHRAPTRVIDIQGDIINEPAHYHECLDAAKKMLDEMDKDYVDKSDMIAVVDKLMQDIRFHFLFLKRRT